MKKRENVVIEELKQKLQAKAAKLRGMNRELINLELIGYFSTTRRKYIRNLIECQKVKA